MKSEQKFELFSKLKEEFESATELSEYGNFNTEFEINDDESSDDELIVDLKITWRENSPIHIQLSIDKDEKLQVFRYEDCWEDWTSYSHEVRNLWQVLFFEALDK